MGERTNQNRLTETDDQKKGEKLVARFIDEMAASNMEGGGGGSGITFMNLENEVRWEKDAEREKEEEEEEERREEEEEDQRREEEVERMLQEDLKDLVLEEELDSDDENTAGMQNQVGRFVNIFGTGSDTYRKNSRLHESQIPTRRPGEL